MILNTQSMRWVFLPVEWVCHFHSLFPLDFKDNPESGNIKSVKQRTRIPVNLVSGSTPSKESESCSIMTDSSRTENSSQNNNNNNNNNNNPGVGWHSFLQGIFPSQGSNPGLLHYRQFIIWAKREAFQGPSFYVHTPNNLGNARMQFQFLNQCKLNPAHFLFALLLLFRL